LFAYLRAGISSGKFEIGEKEGHLSTPSARGEPGLEWITGINLSVIWQSKKGHVPVKLGDKFEVKAGRTKR
jgi:hypothetical protein